jgi:hypothetical protein
MNTMLDDIDDLKILLERPVVALSYERSFPKSFRKYGFALNLEIAKFLKK